MNSKHDVIVVGAGLAGLTTTLLLSEAGRNVCLLEARETVGGRIRSVREEDTNRFLADLGPSWVWPMFQPVISQWLDRLELDIFEQFETGRAILDYGPQYGVQSQPMLAQDSSMRVVGGSQALVDALKARLPENCLLTNAAVSKVEISERMVTVHSSSQAKPTLQADKLVIAMPPRLAANKLLFEPALPPQLFNTLKSMPTWMAPHAKVVAIYETAFWREMGLSGRIASRAGPIVEAHDHCAKDGTNAAIWGFIGWPHDKRAQMGDALHSQVKEQLMRCFGADKPTPIFIHIEDWSQQETVTSPADLQGPMHHPSVGPALLRQAHFDNRLWFAGAETAERSPGLIEGAFDAAEKAAKAILAVD